MGGARYAGGVLQLGRLGSFPRTSDARHWCNVSYWAALTPCTCAVRSVHNHRRARAARSHLFPGTCPRSCLSPARRRVVHHLVRCPLHAM
eukprot:14977016-Alexandrium_andersonii.AAC.1